jgi:hypothetical protein
MFLCWGRCPDGHMLGPMPRWPKEIADAVFFDIRFGLTFRVGPQSRPATDAEIDLVARAIVERLQQSNWLIQRGPSR